MAMKTREKKVHKFCANGCMEPNHETLPFGGLEDCKACGHHTYCPPAQAVPRWQSIETAPRGVAGDLGPPILAAADGRVPSWVRWNPAIDGWESAYAPVDGSHRFPPVVTPPTHWFDIPPLSASSSQAPAQECDQPVSEQDG